MCGIVGYLGNDQAYPILVRGLHRLEYRGYDSAGVSLINSGAMHLFKCKGKVSDLEALVDGKPSAGTIGIGHTRWATHGVPNDINAHPHLSGDGNIALIHNGIIENYATLKEELINRGHTFVSDTDTEVLTHFIEEVRSKMGVELFEAVRIALSEVVGAYAIVIIDKNNPDQLIAAKKSSPLVLGIGSDGDFYVASDATPIIEYTKNVVYLEDEEVALMDRNGELKIVTIQNQRKTPYIHALELKLEAIEKGGYDSFMLKEIHEQPRSIMDSIRGRLNLQAGFIKMSGIDEHQDKWINARRIIIVACGTSWHAGLVAEYLIEEFARIPVEVEYASEFRYRNPVLEKGDIVIAISQSGETADTLAAIELAKEKGAFIFGVCNVVGSTISRATHTGAYTHAGPEIGVASTKAFTAQVTVLYQLALAVADKRGTIAKERLHRLMTELYSVPDRVEEVLKTNAIVETIAEIYKDSRNALYLGRGYTFPVALEGALKLKEISYIHAEGYPAAEMKHGPIALIDEEMPVFVIATQGHSYEKVVSNIQEVKARKGKIIAIVTAGDKTVKGLADHVIEIPKTDDSLVPIISVIPFQLLAYHIAMMRGCNVDQPRNLAKSVT
ncbi:MAG: glutamine--fructose-6-phosphate transaminase (isomerizing), partial [Flavobacteriales bacterium]|nr:glutamine--fructose-6-phosphate transaminase (isomerizing) [Flavobacteriales bacterium]